MQNAPVSSLIVAGGLFMLFQVFCTGNNLETVESRDAEGRLERWQRNKTDFAKEGLYQRFSPDGTIAEEAHYVRDSLDGERKFFFPNGRLESVEHYRNGVFHGKYRKYDENGNLLVEQEFADGAMQGLSLVYYPNGVLKEKYTIRDNEENGPFQEFYENGNIRTEGAYAPGKDGTAEQGELKEYDENGQLVRIADCRDGICLTKWKKDK